MTTLYLTQKYMAMKLDRNELEKIKFLKVDNMQKKHKAVHALRKILDMQAVNKTCRLCLKSGSHQIYGHNVDFDIAGSIKCLLGVEVSESDGKPQHVCSACEEVLRQAAQLRQTAEATQWRLQQELDMVAESPLDWDVEQPEPVHGGHYTAHGSGVTRHWSCGRCKRTFPTYDQFSEHDKLPSCRQTQRYMCETCGVELKSMWRLKRHQLTHLGGASLRHACAWCAYRARSADALRVHELGHRGARPARCALCAASFVSASNLAAHRRSHLPPRYRCAHCTRAFKFNEGLLNHIATQHSTAKPYNCTYCGKAFSTRKLIRRHELKVHNRPKMRSGVVPSYLRVQNE